MSQIDDLIRRYCPNGVEFRALGEIGELVRGNGIQKSDFVESGVGCIHYGQIHTHYGTWATATKSFVTPELAARTRRARSGDLVIATTSEDDEAVGKAVAWLGTEEVAVSTDAIILRHSLDPKYVSYFFQARYFRSQKHRYITGTKVRRIGARALSRIQIPVPPPEVQGEIVRVLDLFQSLEAALEAELEARLLQYTHYRDSLLDFSSREGVRWVGLGDVGALFGGLSGKSKADFQDGNARYISYMNVYENIAADVEANDRVRIGESERQNRLRRGDVLFTGSSETRHECGMSSVVVEEPPEPVYLNSFCIGFRAHDHEMLDPEFAKHLFRSAALRDQIVQTANGVTRYNVSKRRLAKVLIPIPGKDEQGRLASLLDRFELLVNGLSVGLPAELAARRAQYQHYRDRLLTFEEVA